VLLTDLLFGSSSAISLMVGCLRWHALSEVTGPFSGTRIGSHSRMMGKAQLLVLWFWVLLQAVASPDHRSSTDRLFLLYEAGDN